MMWTDTLRDLPRRHCVCFSALALHIYTVSVFLFTSTFVAAGDWHACQINRTNAPPVQLPAYVTTYGPSRHTLVAS